MPTKRAGFILLFSLIILCGAWASKLVWLYLFCATYLSFFFLSYLLSRLLVVNMEIHRELPAQAYEGSLVNVTVKIRNRLPLLDQSVEISDNFSAAGPQRAEKVFFLHGLSRGSLQFTYQEKCYKRGKYKIGPFKVKIFEPFGLFFIQKELAIFSELVVYPQIFTVNRLPYVLGTKAPRFGRQTTRISGDYEEFYGVREYHQEDGWRRIHWRSTARLSELTVRHFEQSSQWKVMFVLDAKKDANLGFGRDTTFEYGIKIIASLSRYLLHKKASFGLIASPKKPFYINIGSGRDQYYRIMDELAVIDSDGDRDLPQLISGYEWLLPQNSSLVVIIHKFNPGLIKYLHFLKIEKNIGIIPVFMDTRSFQSEKYSRSERQAYGREMKRICADLAEDVYSVGYQEDLKLIFC